MNNLRGCDKSPLISHLLMDRTKGKANTTHHNYYESFHFQLID